jgi:hypothetical protein
VLIRAKDAGQQQGLESVDLPLAPTVVGRFPPAAAVVEDAVGVGDAI